MVGQRLIVAFTELLLSDLVSITFKTDSTMNRLSFDNCWPVFWDFLRDWARLSLVFLDTFAEGITGVG